MSTTRPRLHTGEALVGGEEVFEASVNISRYKNRGSYLVEVWQKKIWVFTSYSMSKFFLVQNEKLVFLSVPRRGGIEI